LIIFINVVFISTDFFDELFTVLALKQGVEGQIRDAPRAAFLKKSLLQHLAAAGRPPPLKFSGFRSKFKIRLQGFNTFLGHNKK
jgi:hypothetical protein